MTGAYPPGCTQRDHDRAFSEMGPDPSDELRAQEAEDEAFWLGLFEYAEIEWMMGEPYEP